LNIRKTTASIKYPNTFSKNKITVHKQHMTTNACQYRLYHSTNIINKQK